MLVVELDLTRLLKTAADFATVYVAGCYGFRYGSRNARMLSRNLPLISMFHVVPVSDL